MRVEAAAPLLSAEEQDMLTINALLGSIDDTMAELEQARRNKADEEVLTKITGKVTNTYVAARESFSDNLEHLYSVFEAMEMRVSAMGCNHDHFLESSLAVYDTRSEDSLVASSHDRHKTQSLKKDKQKQKEKNTKKSKKVKKLRGWALLGIVTQKPQ